MLFLMSEIIFLGTAGGRMVVATQLRKSGGMWLVLNGKNILLDPGPGCLMRSVELGFRPGKLDCIILSHKHIDHSNDINIMIEAMSGGSFRPRGVLLAPRDALEGEDPVVLRYVRRYIRNNIKVLHVARPGTAILNHFGMQVVKAGPDAIARRIEVETGVPTIAAADGMRFSLDTGKTIVESKINSFI